MKLMMISSFRYYALCGVPDPVPGYAAVLIIVCLYFVFYLNSRQDAIKISKINIKNKYIKRKYWSMARQKTRINALKTV
jgi:hypothetical protein